MMNTNLRFLVFSSYILLAMSQVSFMSQSNLTATWCAATSCLGALSYNVVVGQPITFNVTALNIQRKNSAVKIQVLTDPGIPNGAQLTATNTTFIQQNFVNASAVPLENYTVTWRTFTFVPRRRQEGLVYKVCFVASDAVSNATRCVGISVAAPVPSFHALAAAPTAAAASPIG
mmetsp:Transcript_24430/g.65277  ORF Transcript_24430/g.65277 Transcript_24430/m.65277 type:complete len:174 (+) Transcript_24430:106-627(+)